MMQTDKRLDETKPRPIAGAPRFSIVRYVEGYAYPRNGNLHNPTPRYRYLLLLDGREVDTDARERKLRQAAKAPNAVKAYSA